MEIKLKTRASEIDPRGESLGGGFAGSIALHGAFAALLLIGIWIAHSGKSWGDTTATAGAIQASMVNALPLPPKQPPDANNMLATDAPSPAPVEPKPKTIETPPPDAVPVPVKTPVKTPAKTPVKVAEKSTPAPPLHPQPMKVDPTKVQTGEATGMKIAMSSQQTRAGTVSVGTTDAAFGTRFAYYVQQITQKVAQQWYTGMLDSQAPGHRVYITFQVERDGTLSHITVAQRSGDFTLDQTALNAVRHIDTFGPLPDAYTGNHINVTYYFDPPTH
ncbi:MAG: TonB family protein [Acidobacteriaceae bacterium]|nr:TonB family protein [Acidobacteriaceae bacterium]